MTFRSVQRGRFHSYQLDGATIPSVTKLISQGVPKPNLIDWAAKMAAEYTADNLDNLSRLERDAIVDVVRQAHRRTSSTRMATGTSVHEIADQLLQGITAEYPLELEGYVTAYLAWMDDWSPEIIAVETPVCSRRYRYGGRFDLLCRMQGQVVLIDNKTGGSGVWPEVCLQLAGYRFADIMLIDGVEQPMPHVDAGYALWLGDDGHYELLPVQCDEAMFSVFKHAAHVAHFMGLAKDDLIGLPLERPAPPHLEVV